MHHFLRLLVGETGMETSSLLESSMETPRFRNMNILNSTSSPLTTSISPPGIIGVGLSSTAKSSVLKHHRPTASYRFADNHKFLSVFTIIGLILIFSNFSKMSGVDALPRCPSNIENNEEPGDCSYGVTQDYCGRKVCAKGPGQICGVGLFKLLGSCGEGLYCNCGRCTGCSLYTMECFDKTCV